MQTHDGRINSQHYERGKEEMQRWIEKTIRIQEQQDEDRKRLLMSGKRILKPVSGGEMVRILKCIVCGLRYDKGKHTDCPSCKKNMEK